MSADYVCQNIMSLGVYFILKKLHSSKLARLLDTASKFALFSVSGLKDKKLIKKQTYTKTETCKLYSRVFWIFFQISSKSIFIILSYTVSKLARFFETQCNWRMATAAADDHSFALEYMGYANMVSWVPSYFATLIAASINTVELLLYLLPFCQLQFVIREEKNRTI